MAVSCPKKIIQSIIILWTVLSHGLVYALPSGWQVESGHADFSNPNDATLEITASDQSIINFDSFSIGANETVRFIQPNGSSTLLSRVLGNQSSWFNGSLLANGTIFLINPHGIGFGAGSNVQVNNLAVSTLGIASNDFLNRNYVFSNQEGSPYSQILNKGNIKANNLALIASSVDNKGVIDASLGSVQLASGNKVTMSFDSKGLIQVAVNEETLQKATGLDGQAVTAAVANSGRILGGKVGMNAQVAGNVFENAIKQTGTIKATQLVEEKGVIKIISNRSMQISGALDAMENVSKEAIEISTPENITVHHDLSIKGNSNISAGQDIHVDADVKAESGDLDILADADLNGQGSFHQKAGATISTGDSGDITIQSSGDSTIANVDSSGDLILKQGGVPVVFNFLSSPNALIGDPGLDNVLDSSRQRRDGNDIMVAGSLYIQSGVTLNAGDAILNVGKDWINEGIFNAGTSSVDLTSNQDAKVQGNNTFYNFSSHAPSKIIYFEAGKTQTILGTWAISGAYAQHVKMLSSEEGKVWYVNPVGSRDFTFAWVKDSYNLSPDKIIMTESTNKGNSFNWDPTGTWIGVVNNLWSDPGNWSGLGGAIPGAGDDVVMGGTATIDTDFTIASLSFGGGTLTQNANLTMSGNYTQSSGSFISDPTKTFSVGGSFSIPITTVSFKRFTGTGSSGDPYLIYDVYGLQAMTYGLFSSFKLNNNIDASATAHWNVNGLGYDGFLPIGSANGTLYGNGKAIDSLYINRPSTNNIGLHGNTFVSVENIGLTNANITGNSFVGGLMGVNNSTVTGSYVTGSINGNGNNVGGLVGQNQNNILNSYSTASVYGSLDVGGLVGSNNSVINNSYATGAVTGDQYVGGLIGDDRGVGINNLYATGNVSGNLYVGGLIGASTANSSVLKTYSTGNVTGDQYVGGLIGWKPSGILKSSYSTGSVIGNLYVGGLIGRLGGLGPVTITNNAWWTGASTNAVGYYTTTGTFVNTLASKGWGTDTTLAVDFYNPGHQAYDSYNAGGNQWGFGGGSSAIWVVVVDNTNKTASYPILGWQSDAVTMAGSGSGGDPYLITNVGQLQSMLYNRNKTFKLFNDINADIAGYNTGSGFVPVGTAGSAFTGSLEGNNKTINHLYINRASTDYIGLFGYTDSGGSIDNVGIINADITGQNYVGGLVGRINNTSISHSYTTGSVNGSGNYVGGLGGYYGAGSMISSYSSANVNGASGVGGLVGESNTTISNAYSTGNVVGTGSFTGGLVGINGGVITNSYATASVSGDISVGGLVGYNSPGDIINSYATGSVSGNIGVGGLVGYNDVGSTITNAAWWTGSSSNAIGLDFNLNASVNTLASQGWGTDSSLREDFHNPGNAVYDPYNVGGNRWGFAGGSSATWVPVVDNANKTASYPILSWQSGAQVMAGSGSSLDPYLITNVGQVELILYNLDKYFKIFNNVSADIDGYDTGNGFMPVGDPGTPFIGSLNGNSKIINNLYINRPGEDYIGLLRYASNASISNVGLTNVIITGSNYVGGLVGINTNSSTITNAYATGTVTGSNYVGGLAGINTNSSTITNAYATGIVTGSNYVGGLAGYANASTIIDTYAIGNVLGSGSYVGGLVGHNDFSSINNAYATGSVTGSNYVGGLVGLNSGTINTSYATGDVLGNSEYIGGLVGDSTGSITNSYAKGNVGGNNYVGGLAGSSNGITNSYALGSVSGNLYVGGLSGSMTNDILNSYSTGYVNGSAFVGGFVGIMNGGSIINSAWSTGSGVSSGDVVGYDNIFLLSSVHFLSDQGWGTDSSTTSDFYSSAHAVYNGGTPWDFATTWWVDEASLPLLRTQLSYFTLSGTASMNAGTTNELTVRAYDAWGNLSSSFTGNHQLIFSGLANSPLGIDPAIEGFDFGQLQTISFSSGVSASNTTTLNAYAAESATVHVSGGSIAPVSSVGHGLSLVVSPANLHHFNWSAIGSQTAGTAFTATITAKDLYGNTTTKDTDSSAFTSSESIIFGSAATTAPDGISKPSYNGGDLTDGETVNVDLSTGVFTTSNILLYNASQTPAIISTHSTATGNSGAITVNAANLDHFIWSVIGTQTAGNPFTATITAKDLYGNTTTKDTDSSALTGAESVTFSSIATTAPDGVTKPSYNGGDLTDGETVNVNLSSGSFTTSNIALYDASETPTLTLTHNTKTGTSGAISVAAAAANNFAFLQQPTTTEFDFPLIPYVTVQVRDEYHNIRTQDHSTIVTMGIGTNPGAGSLAGTLNQTAVGGTATFNDLKINGIGQGFTLTASSAGLTSATSDLFNMINLTGTFRWIGTSSTSWNDPANWNSGTVPDANTVVILPATGNSPILDSDVLIAGLTLGSGQTFLTSGYRLSIGGDLILAGTLDAASSFISIGGSLISAGGAVSGSNPNFNVNGWIGTQDIPVNFLTNDKVNLQAGSMNELVSISVSGGAGFNFNNPTAGFVFIGNTLQPQAGQGSFRTLLKQASRMASIKHANAFDFTNPVPGFLLIDAPQKLDEPQDNIELQPILLDVPGMAIFKIPHLQYLNSNILKIILDY